MLQIYQVLNYRGFTVEDQKIDLTFTQTFIF